MDPFISPYILTNPFKLVTSNEPSQIVQADWAHVTIKGI